jgi:hypothetical protein
MENGGKKMKKVNWWKLKDQSLGLAAREAGYDLAMYPEYPPSVRALLKAAAIKNVMATILDDFGWQFGRELGTIKQGVYVICLANPFTIKYGQTTSDIVYIGRGNICGRLKSHFENSLFDVMMSLAGSNFTFHLSEPIDKAGEGYFKQLEFDLLENFRQKIGDGKYPILNKNAGSDQNLKLGEGWNKPLKGAGKKPTWAIEPTYKRPIKKLTN